MSFLMRSLISGFVSAACLRSICAFHGLYSVSSFSILFPFVLAVSLCLSAYVLWAHSIYLSIYFFVETRKTFPSLALLFSTIYLFMSLFLIARSAIISLLPLRADALGWPHSTFS